MLARAAGVTQQNGIEAPGCAGRSLWKLLGAKESVDECQTKELSRAEGAAAAAGGARLGPINCKSLRAFGASVECPRMEGDRSAGGIRGFFYMAWVGGSGLDQHGAQLLRTHRFGGDVVF